MPAYFDTGFCVRQPSWHRQENLLADYPEDWAAARVAAGLEWEPTYLDLYVPRMVPKGTATQELPEGTIAVAPWDWEDIPDLAQEGATIRVCTARTTVHVPVLDFRAIARDDTMDVLATPKDSFQLIYHAQMGDLLEAYAAAGAGKVLFETAGSVRGGAMVWALLRLDEPWHAPGDDSATYPYAVLLNAHDGSAACKLVTTSVRVVCWNTWRMAEAEGDRTGQQVVLRHTGNVEEKVEQAKVAVAAMRQEASAWQELATDLAAINVSDALVATFLQDFIPMPENATERTRNQRAERQQVFLDLYQGSPTTDGVRGTAYGLVQAAGEYLDHVRPFRNADTYLARTLLQPEPVKNRVIGAVRELVAAGTN